MLRAARELLAVRSPLDAELMVSELLGTWWRQPQPTSGRARARRRAEVEELVGEGLVDFAADQGSPAALALLSGIACLGTSRQAVKAERAALALMESGVARPAWAEHAGAVEAGACYVSSDAFCDRDEVICTFSYAGTEEHALVVVVDYNAGGMLRDSWVTSHVSALLDRCKELAEPAEGPAQACFRSVSPPSARRLLESALQLTEKLLDPPVSPSFPSYHAFVRARIRTLPPTGPKVASLTEPSVLANRRTWRPDRRAMLAAEFLASDEAEDLSDIEAASRCVDHIVDYGCDQDFGRPLRVSPAKLETFLLDWLPRKVMLTKTEQHAMPHVLLSWARWAGAKSGLDAEAIRKTLDAVFDSMSSFSKVYRDPTSYGLKAGLVARLLPDRDLEALPRRAFAFGVLEGHYHGTNLAVLDPAHPEDRRILLAADHEDRRGKTPTPEHLDEHMALTERLWRGDPPELWEAAQRLLDLGLDRHDVVHALMDAVETAGPAAKAIAHALSNLPPEPQV